MGAYVFPTFLFNPSSLRPSLVGAAISGGVTFSGDAQFADLSGGGRWVIEFGETALITPLKVKLWRALAAVADGGATPILVPLGDRRHQPLVTRKYAGADSFGRGIYDDGLTPWAPEEITAMVTADAALRATQVEFDYAGGLELVGGEHFSILHPAADWRLYRIVRVVSQVAGAVVAEIRPPLREAVVAGDSPATFLNFDNPRCLMRVDGDMDLTLDFLRFGRAQARFVETFPAVA